MNIDIRDYQPVDTQYIASLFVDTIRNINIRDYAPEQINAWIYGVENWDLTRWQRSFLNKMVFVAEENTQIIGFGELENNGHIDRFYVHKDYIGQGVGSQIYRAIEAKAIALGIEKLCVEASLTAKSFFEKIGFHLVRKQTVVRNEVELINFVMIKDLKF